MTKTTPNAKLASESYDEKFDRMKERKAQTTPLHIMQFERIRKNLHDVFMILEGACVPCVREYQELLDDVRSIESALRRYMEVNHEQGAIITDLTNQNCELKHDKA